MKSQEQIKKQNQKTIILILIAFIAPALIAWLEFKFDFFSSGTKNYGDFVSPPVSLSKFKLQSVEGKIIGIEQLRGKWHLLYIGEDTCGRECKERLSVMHQARMAQGKAMSRVGLLYIAKKSSSLLKDTTFTKKISRLTVMSGEEGEVSSTVKLFKPAVKQGVDDKHLIYLIDPLGNLMMRYKKEVRLIGIIKDMEHLLKVSQIG